MIKARGDGVVIFGLSRGNCERLLQAKPIRIDGSEVGLPGLTIIIMGGETEQSMEADLRRMGAIGPDTQVDDRWEAGRGG